MSMDKISGFNHFPDVIKKGTFTLVNVSGHNNNCLFEATMKQLKRDVSGASIREFRLDLSNFLILIGHVMLVFDHFLGDYIPMSRCSFLFEPGWSVPRYATCVRNSRSSRHIT